MTPRATELLVIAGAAVVVILALVAVVAFLLPVLEGLRGLGL